jgi:hypothetical protein
MVVVRLLGSACGEPGGRDGGNFGKVSQESRQVFDRQAFCQAERIFQFLPHGVAPHNNFAAVNFGILALPRSGGPMVATKVSLLFFRLLVVQKSAIESIAFVQHRFNITV